MNQTPARLNSSSFLYHEPTARVSRCCPSISGSARRTDQMRSSKGRSFEKAGDGAQDVQMPAMFDLRLREGNDRPCDLERGQ